LTNNKKFFKELRKSSTVINIAKKEDDAGEEKLKVKEA